MMPDLEGSGAAKGTCLVDSNQSSAWPAEGVRVKVRDSAAILALTVFNLAKI